MKTQRKIGRFISAFLVLILCVESVFSPDLALAFQNSSSLSGAVRISDKIKLPEFASAEWVRAPFGSASRGVVYLIQDAHTSLLAQQRITQTLEHLLKQKALDAVLVEGASGELTRERFAHIPDLKQAPELIEKLERQGYLHGASVFALLNPEVSAAGIESPELYRANFELFRKVMKSETEVRSAVSAFQVEWQRWLKLRAQKEDYDFFLNSAAYQVSPEGSDYFEQLIAMASLELGIQWQIRDQQEWPNLIRLQRMLEIQPKLDFKKAREEWLHLKKILPGFTEKNSRMIDLRMGAENAGTSVSEDDSVLRRFAEQLVQELIRKRLPLIPYRAFFDWLAMATFQAEIEPEVLILEIEKLENKIWNKKFQSKGDRRAAKLGRMAILFDQAGRLELSRGAVRRFQAMVKSDEFKFWISKLLPEKKQFIIDFSAQLLDFYAVAERREEAFFEKLNRAVDAAAAAKSSLPYVAVVAGGYHKDGLLELLKEKSFDVAVLTPKLERIDHDISYRERMLEPAVEISTLSPVPAAVVSASQLTELVGDVAPVYEASLAASLAIAKARSEARNLNYVAKVGSGGASRRGFLMGAAAFFSFPVVSAAQDVLDGLLREASKPSAAAPHSEFKTEIFPVANLQMNSSEGMDGYLAGILERVSQNLPGLKNKWSRVVAEAERMRVITIGATLSYSEQGGLVPGIRARGVSGDNLDITSGGISLAMRTIGFLMEELLVNPVRNQADIASIRAAEMNYQWKKIQLAGEAARLILMLKAAESKFKVLAAYANQLSQAEKQVGALVAAKSATDEQLNIVSSFLNEAKDSQGQLQVEITQAREGLKMLLGADFKFDTAVVPVPVRAWLNASEKEQAKLIAAAQSRVGRVLSVQSSQSQAEAFDQSAKAEKRRGLFSFFFRRGPANPNKTRKELGLESGKISSNPEAARAQVMADVERVQSRVLDQELRSLVKVEAAKFYVAQDSHARWQRQVYEEQLAWRTRGLLAADYDLDMLTLLKRFVQAQLRVLETRAQMSGAAVAWTTAGLEDQSASSQNWMNPVLFFGFFPAGFTPKTVSALPKRSEVRTLVNKASTWVRQLVVFLSLSLSVWAQQSTVLSGVPGSVARASTAGIMRTWEEKGKIHMSYAAGDKLDLMRLKFPEIVVVDSNGQIKLSSEGQLRYEHLRREFEADLKAYTAFKSGGAKLSELLPRFKLLLEKGLDLDRFERVLSSMTLTASPQFKVIQKQPGTYGVNQSSVEMISTRIAKVQMHVPLRELLGAKIKIEVAGQKGVLISRPRVLELDARGSDGSALIELRVAVDKPINFGSETPYHAWLEKEGNQSSVSNGEPAEILMRDASGAEVSAGVALLLRDRIAVAMPDFGIPQLQAGVEAASAEEGRKVAAISFQRPTLLKFLIDESATLGRAVQSILPSIAQTGSLNQQEINRLREDAALARVVASRLENQRGLMSPASGMLELSPELAAGFPMNRGDSAAWIQTGRVLLKAVIAGNSGKLAEGDPVSVRLANGRKITGKIQSVGADNKAHLYGRNSFVAEFDIPANADELDWSGVVSRNGFSPALLYKLLLQAHQNPGSGLNNLIPSNMELSGGVGMGASAVNGVTQPARVPTLADLIASDFDSLQAHQLFKQHQSGFGAEDYKPLLESKHLSLVYETVKLLLRERGEWAEVMLAFDLAQKKSDLARSRAIYDAVVTALVSGGKEIESGLAKLGIQSRANEPLRQISESVFSVLAVERGLNDSAARRVLDSQFWNAPELLQFAYNLQAGASPQISTLSVGVFEMIWRARAIEQIGAIQNSAYWKKMLAGRDPEHVLAWLDERTILDELVYRNSLGDDRRLLRDGVIGGEAVLPPSVASLIDPQTATNVSIPATRITQPVTLPKGVLGTQPVTLGELDVLSVEQQEQAMRAAASRGDLELLTWVLSSRMSDHLKQTAISILQNTEQGPLVFARWFAGQQDKSALHSALNSYGFPRLLADLTSELVVLEKEKEDSDTQRSLAPARQIIFESLFRLHARDVYPLQDKQADSIMRLLLMLVGDPADLGRLARGEEAASPEAKIMARLPELHLRKAALEELMRRSLNAAAFQYSVLNQSRAMVGEIRTHGFENQLSVLMAVLQPDSFSEKPLFQIKIEADAAAAIQKELATHMTALGESKKLGDLAVAHFQAGWTGKVKVPSASGHQAGFVWTIFSYAKNLIGLFVLGIFSWLFFRQSVVRARKIKAMQRGEAVQFYDSLAAWKKDFKEEILQSGVVKDGEGKKRIVLGLNEWSELLSAPNPDYARIFELAQSIFSWPNLSLRLENFKGFRHDDRQRDRVLIYALTSLSYLTLKHLSEREEVSEIQDEIYHFLKDRSHRIVIFSYILFQLKNLKENESYNAVEPNIANSAIQRLRLKAYRFQQRVWPPVRKIYAMDKASQKIRHSLTMLVAEYENLSAQIGDSAGSANSDQIRKVIEARYSPREPWGKSPDNATIAGDRKLATRIFNFVAALGSIPAILGQVHLIFVLFPMVGSSGVAAIVLPLFFLNTIMLFSAFTYLSHLYANLANLHDVQAEEFLDHLSRVERLMEIKPRSEPPTSGLPATALSATAPQASPKKESLRGPASQAGWRTFLSVKPAADVLRTDLAEGQALQIDDLLAELNASEKTPGFDAVVVQVNEADASALRPVIKSLIQKKYGYQVPVAVIGVDGVSNGNGVPAMGAFTNPAQMFDGLRKDKADLPGIDQLKLLVLEAYGPDLDIANLTAGSIFLSPTGIKDDHGDAVTTGALALARAAISMREVKSPVEFRFKTDTYNLNRLPSDLPGDITFAVTLLPAKEVVGRFGVPIFSKSDPTRIKGFFEKVDSFGKLKHLYKQRTGIEIEEDTKIPVFTGDMALQFKSKDQQDKFKKLSEALSELFKTILSANSAFQFDEVLDFWVPLIMLANKSTSAPELKDLLVSYAGYRAKVSNDGKTRSDHERIDAAKVYSHIYFKILRAMESSQLSLSIHGIVGQGEFSDVRDVEPLVSLNLARQAEGTHQTVTSSDLPLNPEGAESVTVFGLNGNKPTMQMKGLLMASVPMRRGQETIEAIVYGMRGAWGSDRLHNFEETHLGFNTDLFVDENGTSFLAGIDFKSMPLFPTRMTQPEQTNRLVKVSQLLAEGKPVRVTGGIQALRKAGYVSLEDIQHARDFLGMDAPVHRYSVKGPARRSELRKLTQLIRTGAAAAALVIFYGILPPKAVAATVKFEQYAGTILASVWDADKRALVSEGLRMLENNPVAKVNTQLTLFVDGDLIAGREILADLKTLSDSEFGIELLFTDRIGFESAKAAVGGKTELGKLKIRLGSTIGEMVAQTTVAQNSDDLDNKKNFAFLGNDEAMARRLRANVANLMILKKSEAIPVSILLEALLSPAIFSLNFKPNKIWSMDLVLPMLLAARQIARSA